MARYLGAASAGRAGALLAATVASLAACSDSGDRLTRFAGPTMGTTYSVQAVDLPAEVDSSRLGAGIAAELESVNAQMSTYREDSELSRFNRFGADTWFPVSRPTLEVVAEAQRINRLSGGAFDATVGPLVNLWGFGPGGRAGAVPGQPALETARARVGAHLIDTRTSPPALRKERADLYLDLSAIAKGHGVDRVAAYLESAGVHNYLVEIGGDMRVKGRNDRDLPWTVAVERPEPLERRVFALLRPADGGLATSGDYRNFFEQDGRRYSHTIDPRTGAPVTHALAAVTVVAETAMRADGLATAILVLGPKQGYEFAAREKIAALLIIHEAGGFIQRSTPQLEAYLYSGGAPGSVAQASAR